MGKYYDMLMEDVRMKEGLTACMNCGICTGLCPAAMFYDYDPRQIVTLVQSRNDEAIETLLKSETIWYCGECMSCRPRCPRGNTPGYIILSLRNLSQRLGFFTESEKGRQQIALKRVVGHSIIETGYCLRPQMIVPEDHLEQGPVWKWIHDNDQDIYTRFSENYTKPGVGALRKIDPQALDEIKKIFDVTGGTEFFETIERHSDKKAREMGFDGVDNEYVKEVYTKNSGNHT